MFSVLGPSVNCINITHAIKMKNGEKKQPALTARDAKEGISLLM
jgi:hypothetical protein